MRHSDWQNRLTAYLDAIRYKPFVFDSHNCLFFVLGGIKAVNEIDLMPLYENKAASYKDGLRALREIDGVKTVEACLQVRLQQEFQPVTFARSGDVVFIENDNERFNLASDMRMFGPVPGICYGSVSFFLGENGLESVPTMMTDKVLWVS